MDEMKDISSAEFTDQRIREDRPKICTNKKVIIFSIFSLISAAAVVALVYYFRPTFSKIKSPHVTQQLQEESIEKILENPWLPKNVIPTYYRLRVQPNFEDSFTGQITIALNCKQNTDIIILHAKNLNITSIEFKTTEINNLDRDTKHAKSINSSVAQPEIKSVNIEVLKIAQNNSKLFIKLREVMIQDQQYFLNIHFNGNITKTNVGIVENHYVNEIGQHKSFISTNFKPFHAREAFPCFDEIGFNARFEVSIAKRTNMVALSNTCMRETEASNKSPGLVWNHFEVTPSVPAHQVGFAVGEMKSVNASSKKAGPVVKIWAQKPALAQTKYISSIAGDILDFIRDWFGVNFPLQKLDLVLVPQVGENVEGNPGLILFRETSLLSNNKSMDLHTKRRIFNLISEAIIHQWSDTYLPHDWSTFWINRGLPIYLTYITQTALLNPSGLDSFGLEILQLALAEESTGGITLFNKIEQERDVSKMFDRSIRRKAGSILRMIGEYFGEESFRRGFVDSIKNRNFSTETSFCDNLTLTDSLGKNFSAEEMMRSWSRLSGFPLLEITRDYETSTIKIQQVKFANIKGISEQWMVPLTYKIQGKETTYVIVLDQKGMKINSTIINKEEWILFNLDQIGYYRVNYDLTNWNMLIHQLKNNHTEISLPNRVQLVNDAFELANFGYMRHTIPFKLINYLENEVNYGPWKVTVDALDWIEGIISETKHFGIYKKYVLRLLKAEEKRYNFTETNVLDMLQINKICWLRYKPCTIKASKMFENLFLNYTQQLTVPMHFQHTIYCLGIESGPEEYWDFVWELSKNATTQQRELMYSALGCSREMWKLTSFLEKTLTGTIELDFVEIVWRSLSKKPIGRLVGMSFLENRWADIYSSYKVKPNIIRVIIEEFLSNLATDVDLKKVAAFYSKHRSDLRPMSEVMKNALAKIKMRISWMEKYIDIVLPLLTSNATVGSDVW